MRNSLRKISPSHPNLDEEKATSESEKHNSSSNGEDDSQPKPSAARSKSRSRGPRKAGYEQEDPFGDDDSDGKGTSYRTLKWWQAAMIMIAETISLGILSLPSVLATVGILPGVLLIIGLGVIATYSGYVLGQFKMKYPHVHTMAEAGEILFKPLGMPRFGKEFLGTAQVIFLIFSMGGHVLTWTIAMNTITDSATCTIVWSVVALVLFWICDLPRTLKNVSWLSIASFISIFSAVMLTMIDLGLDPAGRGTAVTEKAAFPKAFLSVTNIIFAYAGHVAFFSFISEFKDPKEFPKALVVLQIADVSIYVIAAAVIYRYTGSDVDSPALGSTNHVVKKVAYGIALPTIIVAGVIYGHVSTKYVYVRLFRGTPHLHSNSLRSIATWAGIALTFWTIAWIIAQSIPDFNDLLALISSLFASWFTYGISGIMWLFMNKGRYGQGWKMVVLTACNVGLVLLGAVICGVGLYASGKAIHEGSGSGSSWTCKSNAQ